MENGSNWSNEALVSCAVEPLEVHWANGSALFCLLCGADGVDAGPPNKSATAGLVLGGSETVGGVVLDFGTDELFELPEQFYYQEYETSFEVYE